MIEKECPLEFGINTNSVYYEYLASLLSNLHPIYFCQYYLFYFCSPASILMFSMKPFLSLTIVQSSSNVNAPKTDLIMGYQNSIVCFHTYLDFIKDTEL